MERRRREYAKQDIVKLIEAGGEEARLLVPNPNASKPRRGTWIFPSCLPLECFDDESFDSRTPDEWMELAFEIEFGQMKKKPIPGRALLPVLETSDELISPPVSYQQDTALSNPRPTSSSR